MRRFPTWLALAAVVVLAVAFALGNAGRVVSINLGLLTLSRVPVTFVAFGGMLVGMGVVLAAGINADLKVRRLLREHHVRKGLAATRPGGAARDEREQGDMRLE